MRNAGFPRQCMGMRTTAGLLLCLVWLEAAAHAKPPVENGGFEKGMRGWFLINNSGNSKHEFDKNEKKEG